MVDNHGLTALHLAAKGGSLQMIRLLLKRGAAMDAVDDIGRTPLHLCSGWGWEKPKLLLEAGADPSIRAKNGESVAIRMADQGLGMAMEVIFRLGFRFRGSDVLETVKVGEKEEIRVSRLLWYTYVNGDVELAQNLLDSGKITSDDKKEGIKWALKEKAQSVLDLLSPTLDKKYLEATLGTEFATLLIQPVSGTRTEDILFIIRSNYLNLNETYLPAEHQDHRPLRHRVKFNPLIEASERGELEFVTEMLRKQTCTPIGNHVIRMAHRLARQEKHERVVEVLAGYLEVLTSG
jgi:ankyrin repeat protein